MFHLKLKEKRLEKKLTQEEIAKMLKISRIQYNRYENGKSLPNINTLVKISKILDTNIEYFIN